MRDDNEQELHDDYIYVAVYVCASFMKISYE